MWPPLRHWYLMCTVDQLRLLRAQVNQCTAKVLNDFAALPTAEAVRWRDCQNIDRHTLDAFHDQRKMKVSLNGAAPRSDTMSG
jgi:hypothetical protein